MTIYVNSNAGGANNGTSWTDAYTDAESAVGATAGENVLVAYNHDQGNEVSSQTWNFVNGSDANPVRIISADPADDSYRTGAKLMNNSGATDLSIDGSVAVFGCSFVGANGACNVFMGTANIRQRMVDCTVAIGGPFIPTVQNSFCEYESCSIASEYILVSGLEHTTRFKNCDFTTTNASYFLLCSSSEVDIAFEDCDLSGVHASAKLIDGHEATQRCRYVFRRCSLASAISIDDLTVFDSSILIEGCKNGTITVPPIGITKRMTVAGSLSSTLSVYRTGGADDGANANAYSLEMTTTSAALETYTPFGSVIASRWIAPDVSPSGATSKSLFTSTRCETLATPTALTTDSGSTWNGAGVGTKQKIDHTLNNGDTLTVYIASGATLNNDDFWIEVTEPDQVGGLVTVKAFLAKPSTTVYVDPKLEIA